jgi:hypothetical protein
MKPRRLTSDVEIQSEVPGAIETNYGDLEDHQGLRYGGSPWRPWGSPRLALAQRDSPSPHESHHGAMVASPEP